MPLPQPDGALAQPITFELAGGGRLMATGTITPGSSQAFAAEVDRHGEYIKTVVLNSPGGSVTDALVIGQLIRARKFATEVKAGKYCASSCPLVFAGGIVRRAGERAMIGVHQVAAVPSPGNAAPRNEMSLTQSISARCQRYLADMGVNLQVWTHAMDAKRQIVRVQARRAESAQSGHISAGISARKNTNLRAFLSSAQATRSGGTIVARLR